MRFSHAFFLLSFSGMIAANPIKFATFNVALSPNQPGALTEQLQNLRDPQICGIVSVIRKVRPDVLVLNEFNFEPDQNSLQLFAKILNSGNQCSGKPIDYQHQFQAPVNTGVLAPVDISGNGIRQLPEDAFGYGRFPGQYGMAVLSKRPIVRDKFRSFQNFKWANLPNATKPAMPGGSAFYPEDIWNTLRLSSKSHWLLPIQRSTDQLIWLVMAHPTPPVFDGPEDRNGARNFDEIRLIAELLDANTEITDDNALKGGLPDSDAFVIAGDLNADPHAGDSRLGAIDQLLLHPRVDSRCIPTSDGALKAASLGVKKAAAKTADFGPNGTMRVDYVLPSSNLSILDCGVFWPVEPPESEWVLASDHRLVWIVVQ